MAKKRNIILENVLVEDYAAEGKSLARVEGKVIFIEKAVPGDVVDVRLTKNKKDWGEGYPVEFHSLSADRVVPFCSHFGVCGGCQWQMLPYEKQLQYKQQQVEEALKRIGKVQIPPISKIIGAGDIKFYRNKLEYTFSTKEFIPGPSPTLSDRVRQSATVAQGKGHQHKAPKDELSFDSLTTANDTSKSAGGSGEAGASGFHARGFFDKVVEIEKCWLQEEPTNIIRNTIAAFARENNFSFYDFKTHQGFLRNVQVRICTTGQVMVNMVFGPGNYGIGEEEKRKNLLDHLLQTVDGITTLLYTVNTKFNDSLHDLDPVTYYGPGYIMETLTTGIPGEAYHFRIGPGSFFQTNTRQAEKLYRVAKEFAELSGKETVYDLYCGTGSIGIFLSNRAKKIVGVELVSSAIQDAIENAALNHITNAEFIMGDVIKICNDDFFSGHGKPDVIISDPPRAGMHEKLVKKILDMEAPLVVYVSCNPSTQARDLALLDEKYRVSRVQPVDMFPHTHHIENIVQLKLK